MKDKREKLYDSLTNVREDFVEEVQRTRSAKRPAWVRWCALAACLCLLVVGTFVWRPWSQGGNKPTSPTTSAAQTAKGITIPKAEVTLSQPDGVAADMLAFFIYQGRCYLQYDWLDHGSDLVGEKVGTATGLIDEWTPKEGYVELARLRYEQAQWEDVACLTGRAVAIEKRPRTYINDSEAWGSLPWDLRSLGLFYTGRPAEALRAAEEAAKLAPDDERIRKNVELIRSRMQQDGSRKD